MPLQSKERFRFGYAEKAGFDRCGLPERGLDTADSLVRRGGIRRHFTGAHSDTHSLLLTRERWWWRPGVLSNGGARSSGGRAMPF